MDMDNALMAAETLSDLRTVAEERAPFFFTSTIIGQGVPACRAARQLPLILVPGAHHNGSLRNDVWDEIEGWIGAVLARRMTS